MLYFEAPYQIIEGLTILRDHADPLQFYYYPMAPRLANNPDGSPCFLFVKYRQDLSALPEGCEPGGGFLNFDVDLHVDDDLIATAAQQLKDKLKLQDTPRLAPIDYRRGTVRLVFLDVQDPNQNSPAANNPNPGSGSAASEDSSSSDGSSATPANTAPAGQPKFVEKASYYATPSLYGDNRACFSVQLSAQGATLVEETLDARTSLIGVVYDLVFVGLRPAYNVNLKVDWSQVYHYVEEHTKVSVIFFSADIDDMTEKLIENRVIQMDVVSFAAGASDADIAADKDEAVKFVKQFITEKFFQPSVNPKEAMTDSWAYKLGETANELRPDFCGYSKRTYDRTDVKHMEINMREKSAVERRIVPQGHLQGLLTTLKKFPKEDYVKEVDLADPFFQQLKVDVVGGAAIASDHIDRLSVHVDYADAQPQDALLATAGETSKMTWALKTDQGFNYNYKYQVFFKPDAPPGADDHLESPLIKSNASKLIIDPRDLYQVQKVHVQTVNLPFDRYTQVEVNLRYVDATANITLQKTTLLSQNATADDWSFRTSADDSLAYEYQLIYYPVGAQPITKDWIPSSNPAVLVSDPYPDTLDITVVPAGSFDKIQRMMVEMVYDDPENQFHQEQMLTFTALTDMKTWSVHIKNRLKRDYSYAAIVQYKDGTVKQFPPVPTSDTLLFVGDIYKRTFKIALSLDGPAFPDASISKIVVNLAYVDTANQINLAKQVVLSSINDTYEWAFQMMDPNADSYTYEITYYGTDGFKRHQAPQPSNKTVLAISTAVPMSV
jgi:hypothetical protein